MAVRAVCTAAVCAAPGFTPADVVLTLVAFAKLEQSPGNHAIDSTVFDAVTSRELQVQDQLDDAERRMVIWAYSTIIASSDADDNSSPKVSPPLDEIAYRRLSGPFSAGGKRGSWDEGRAVKQTAAADSPSSVYVADADADADSSQRSGNATLLTPDMGNQSGMETESEVGAGAEAGAGAGAGAAALVEWRERWTKALASGARAKLEPALAAAAGVYTRPLFEWT
jgi:hypothetical protein